MKDRLKEFLIKKELTARQLADELGVQPSSISHILNGRNKASVDLLEKFIRVFPEMDISYLISGVKSKELPSTSSDTVAETQNDEIISENVEKDKTTDRIVVFFSDGTFKEYFPD